MAFINEQIILEYFYETNSDVNYGELWQRFEAAEMNEVLSVVNALVVKKLLVEVEDSNTWRLTERGKAYIREEAERESREREFKDLELEKTKVDLDLAKKMLEDYPSTKSKASYGLIIAVIVAIVEFVRFLGFLIGKD